MTAINHEMPYEERAFNPETCALRDLDCARLDLLELRVQNSALRLQIAHHTHSGNR